MQRSVPKQMSQQGVFGNLFCDLSLRRLCFWCRHFPKSGGSQASIDGDESAPATRASGTGFFESDDPPGRMVVIRRFIPVLLMAGLFGSSFSVWAQISLVQVTTCGKRTFPGTSCTITATGSGHLIVVGWQSAGGDLKTTMSSVTDNVGNTYVEAGAARSVDAAETDWNDIWYAKNCTAGATSIVITPSTSDTGGVVIWEFSGVDGDAPLDQTATLNSQAATATPTGAAVTITAPNEVVITLLDEAYGLTGIVSGNPFVNDSTLFGNGWAHYITSSTGTYFAQWNQSQSGTYGSSTVSFRAASSYSACDLNEDGTVNILDVELAIDMVLAPSPCTAPFGICNPAFAQAVLTDAMPGGACVLPVLGVSPSSISFGKVTVGSSITKTITLTGTGTAGSRISQATVSGAGFSLSGPSLPLSLPVGQTASFNVTFTPATAGGVSGSIAFVSNALDTPVNEALSGTGVTPSSHSVSLSWTPSTSSSVASYNIYRITSSSPTAPTPPTGYQSLGSVSATTCSPTVCTYTDTNVQAGQSYWYYAVAVNTGGSVSVPSNIVQAVIPTP
jgi:hypothetical protein